MSSRQEEKERRRQERLAREQAEAKKAAARKRLQLVGGVLLGLAALAGVVVAIVVATNGDGGSDEQSASAPEASVKIPPQETTDYEAAAKAAGCTLTNAKYEGAGHEEKDYKPSDYKTNPPTSGTHFPDWYDDGVYAPGTTPNLGMLVHTLEHGRVNLQYAPSTPAQDVAKLEALVVEQNDGYHTLLYENATDMDAAVAATAWTQLLTCPKMNDQVFDAVRTFRARYIDKGPETVP